MLSQVAILLVALAALGKGADFLVEYAARVARRFDVSDLVVGLILTSVGTSLPELAASLAAAGAGSSGLVIGNIVGSNIANIGLVLGFAAVVRPFATEPKMHDRDGFILLASTLVFFGLALDNRIGRLDAAVFLLVYVAYTAFVVRSDHDSVEHRFKDFLKFVFDFEYAAPVARSIRRRSAKGRRSATAKGSATAAAGGKPTGSGHPKKGAKGEGSGGVEGGDREGGADAESERDLDGLWKELAIVAVSLAVVIGGAHYTVEEAVAVARILQVPENLIGVSLIAIGTSLPELLVATAAARKGNAQMIVGNVLGSNIANLLLIGGLAGLVRPLEVSELSVVYTIPILLFFSLALLYFIKSDWRIGRGQGTIAIVAYVGFLVAAFLQGWG